MYLRDSSLLYFYAVAKAGSIRQAAESLHISSSAISRMVAKAEEDFNAKLFERHADGMRLTPGGQLLATQVGMILDQLESVKSHISELQDLKRGTVTLACIEGVVQRLAPGFLTDFHQSYPEITFSVRTAAPDDIVAALLSDTADLGILFGAARQAGVEVLQSYEEPLHVLVSRSHPLATSPAVSFREVAGFRVVMPDPTFGVRRIVDRVLAKRGISMPMLLDTNSIGLTLGMVCAGTAVTLISKFACQAELDSGQLIAIPLAEEELVVGSLTVCKRANRDLSKQSQALLYFIERTFSGLHTSCVDVTNSGD